MRALRVAAGAALLATLGWIAGCAPEDRAAAPPPPGEPAALSQALIERGRQLAALGNCAGCHSTADGAPYAGGAPLRTPFGTVYAGNLTPDETTGLGRWTASDFWRALHEGKGRDGRALVPAFPYTSYTQVARDDSDALFAYLRSLPPVQRPNRPHELRFPYGAPWALEAWQWLFFEPADLPAEEAKRRRMPADVARGAYLVNGLGHCDACHAPRNRFGAPGAESRGGEMPAQGWFAPSLHPVAGQPQARDEIVGLLRDGQTDRNAVLGPMAVVVLQSTQHWPEADLRAVAAYLGTLAPDAAPPPAAPAPAAVQDLGRRLYGERCADCHGARGEGVPGVYPALAGNATVQQANIRNLVRVLRLGGFAPSTAAHPRPYGMPPQTLSDPQMAAVLSHVRQSWGNRAAAVTELDVLQSR